MAVSVRSGVALFLAMPLFLSACAEGALPGFLSRGDTEASGGSAGGTGGSSAGSSVRLVESDVEAPEVFDVAAEGLWDGRPSLGGVWVAHPDVTDPERVIIRNTANDRFVIGALFRRERMNPGPVFQVSSDAASALGILAGAPASISVTALRREQMPDPTPAATAPTATAAATAASTPAAAPARPSAGTAPPPSPATPPAPPSATAAAAASQIARGFIQIGIFSQEANANRAAEQMRAAGLTANVLRETSRGQTIWRVTVGPATTTADRDTALARVRGLGFTDAYAVSR